MPHMSPMQWMTMFIGTWFLLNLFIINNYTYKSNYMKKMNSFYKPQLMLWNWY